MLLINKNWDSLIKPNELKTENINNNVNKANITVGPLERGFGTTIGNALRRVLLSSLQGAAITSFKMDGVDHEYSTIPGVSEDVADIVLNLKNVIVRMTATEKQNLRLRAKGPCQVTAGHIETTHDVEILNPEQVICTLTEGHEIDAELVSETGKGYLPAHSQGKKDNIGEIKIDALFSPIKKVAYKVENSRVGQVTNYDKLIMTVETDGSLSPEMATALAARILQDQFQFFITFDEVQEEKSESKDELQFDPTLLKKVDELELSVRSQNCLKNDNIVYIGDLVCKTEAEMLKTPNFGRKSLNEIKEILSKFGLKFGMNIPDWPPENVEELAKKYEEPY